MTIDPPIRRIAVAGGGIAGWSAAAALKRRLPSLEVEIIASSAATDSIVDRVISTLPSIMDFHADIGLTEADTIARAQSGLRAGTIFDGWAETRPAYVHAHGNYGMPIEGTAFHQQWLRIRRNAQPFDRYSPAAELGRAARVAAPESNASSLAPQIGYGLHLTVERYQQLMRAYALHLGVVERDAELVGVELRGETGFIDKLLLSDEVTVDADLFVDCTGPAASMRSALAGEYIDWTLWLPCDRLIFAAGAHNAEVQFLDRVTASGSGWNWSASSPAASAVGVAYSSAHGSPDEAIAELAPAFRPSAIEMSIRPGRWAEPWTRNCVAIGDSAVLVEPLEWANLHLVHSQVDRLVSMMGGADCAPVELAEYNRQCGAEADRIRDFICLHYVASKRNEPFWQDAARIDPPDSLAHSLSLFTERGRLPYYEEETFSRDSWLAVLLGQGSEPRRTDPLADVVPAGQAERLIASYGDTVRSFVAAQPRYQDAMSNLGQHA